MGCRPRTSLRMLLGRAALFLSVAFLVAVLLLLSGEGSAAATGEARLSLQPARLSPGRGRSTAAARMDLDLAYVSRRRVPNGADPIHNRRAGKSVRPPGRRV